MPEITEQQLEDIEALFVQTGTSLTSTSGSVTLHGVAPATLYFSDRPKREHGHLTTKRFVGLWNEGENSFAVDPPNAVLSFIEDDATAAPEDAVVVLSSPKIDGDKITYAIKILEGTVPARTGPVSLFIDTFGNPLSPVSVAGMRRRERRR